MTILRTARPATAALGLALAVLLTAGCASDQEKIEQYRAEAQEEREAQNYREAVILLRQALKLAPSDASINLELAQTLRQMGRPGDAGFYFGEAYRLDPSLTEAALAQAPLLYESDPEAARNLIEEVLEREPDSQLAYLRRAEIELMEPDTEAALTAALTAVELAPEEPSSHRIAGTVYRAMIRERRLRRLERDPSLYKSALASFRRADELAGGSWVYRNDIAELYSVWPEHEEDAKQAWRDAFAAAREDEVTPGMRVVTNAALQWAFRKRDREFVRWALRSRLEADSDRVRTWQQLADLAEGEEQGAGDEIWQQALEELPGDPEIHTAYATYLGQRNRTDEALAHLESVPPEVAGAAEIDLLLVKLHSNRGSLDQARASLARMRKQHAEDPRTEFAAAWLAVREGRREEAARTLRTISDELARADLFRLLAQVERDRGELRNALAAVNRAFELLPAPDRNLFALRHSIQQEAKEWQGLLQSLREMRQVGLPMHMRETLLFVEANYALDRDARALRVLEQFTSVEEPPLGLVLSFARYEGTTQPDRARELLEGALERYPDAPVVVHALAQVELANGRPERTLALLEGRDDLPPGTRLLRARALGHLERWEEAERDARAVFASEQHPPATVTILSEILRSQGRPEEAIALLQGARDEGRELAAGDLWMLGHLYLEVDNLEGARPVLEDAVAQAPSLHLAHNDLAFVLAETGGDLDRALALASQAKSAMPEHPAVADTLGWVYYRRGMLEPAIREFRAAIAANPRGSGLAAEIHYHLALALRARGQDREALQALDEALALEPGHEEARAVRAQLAAAGAADATGEPPG